ncbi:unnamed protein product [Lathyrus oleraceus]|uniref:BON1-associated protein 2 n=1 Tax=Pisum sativum TaxID=3888 RepID=UPI0021D2EE35|nr:BON1-associated protein 2-like [Pisum sativum]
MEGKQQAHTLEINIISGQSITVDGNLQAEDAYVVVRAESLNSCTTKMANENEGMFSWNEKFMLDIPPHASLVTFEVQCKKYKGIRPVGVARVALSDLLDDNVLFQSCDQTLSYGLRDWDGRKNGVINFSVRRVTREDNLCLEKEQDIIMVSSSRFEDVGFKVRMKKIQVMLSLKFQFLWSCFS